MEVLGGKHDNRKASKYHFENYLLIANGKLTFTMENSGGNNLIQEIKFNFINSGINLHYVPSDLKLYKVQSITYGVFLRKLY